MLRLLQLMEIYHVDSPIKKLFLTLMYVCLTLILNLFARDTYRVNPVTIQVFDIDTQPISY